MVLLRHPHRTPLPLKGGAIALAAVLCLTLTGCGVKRSLIRPKDIPAYEEQQRKKRESLEQDKRELEELDASRGITKESTE